MECLGLNNSQHLTSDACFDFAVSSSPRLTPSFVTLCSLNKMSGKSLDVRLLHTGHLLLSGFQNVATQVLQNL